MLVFIAVDGALAGYTRELQRIQQSHMRHLYLCWKARTANPFTGSPFIPRAQVVSIFRM
jgi:hypothetical protein